jgi:subtilisin family serine protease
MDFKLPEFFINSKNQHNINLWYKDYMRLDDVKKLTKDIKAAPICVLDNTALITNKTLENQVTEIWEFTNENGEAGLHGHHVAGIIACERYGLTPNTKIGTFKVLTSGSGHGMTSWVIEGIKKAQEQGYKVINASLGSDYEDLELKQTVRNFCANGGFFVCASGNDFKDTDYPAKWADEIDGVFSIGALHFNNVKLIVDAYSSSGTVSFVMPGTMIMSSMPDDEYGMLTGTSMATPFFSALLANLLGINPSFKASDIVDLCKMSYLDVETDSKHRDGNGFPNVYDVLVNAYNYKQKPKVVTTKKISWLDKLKAWFRKL